jgi:hypothetical protein
MSKTREEKFTNNFSLIKKFSFNFIRCSRFSRVSDFKVGTRSFKSFFQHGKIEEGKY